MEKFKTIEDFNKRYTWVSDEELHGVKEHWEIMKPDENGNYYGDCESYVRTLMKLFPEIFKGYKIYLCNWGINKDSGYNHALISDGKNAICSNTKRIITLGHYKDLRSVSNVTKVNWFIYLGKMVLTYVVNPVIFKIRKIRN